MRIKVAIANYGDTQLDHLYRVANELVSFQKHEVDLVVHSTIKLECPYKLYPSSIHKALPFVCRKDMADNIDNHDLFIYNENDMLITEDNIDAFIEHSMTLPEGQVSGFIRYEQRGEDKILIDLNPYWGWPVVHSYENTISPINVHQGCWVLLRKDLKRCIDSGQFLVNPHDGPYGMLEQGASDPYNMCGLEKRIPLDRAKCERHLIQHLPTKYSIKEEWLKHGITLRDICVE